jgi:RNA-directed DNA polymerase
MEVDHIIPRSQGGSDRYWNLQLLHRHCHDLKTAKDGSSARGRGISDKDHLIEEPCAVKVASTVLKDSLCQALRALKNKKWEEME